VIDAVGLGAAAGRRVKGYSLGMRQRLGVAAALLGDPQVLLFDEPVNGLDLDGVRWIRALLRGFADEGRTVLVSSHLMSEMQLIADRVVIIGRGRLIADAGIREVLGGLGGQRVRVRTPDVDALYRVWPIARPCSVRPPASSRSPACPRPRSAISRTPEASPFTTWRRSSSRWSTRTSPSPRRASTTTATPPSRSRAEPLDEHGDRPRPHELG
jgi:hypothetical protein